MYFLIDKNSSVPAYQQIVDSICNGIRDGYLGPGDQMLTEHSMVARLGVSRPTVSKGYERLRLMGVITSMRGSGSVISDDVFSILGIKSKRPMRKIAYLVSAIGRMSQIPVFNRHQAYDVLEGISQRIESSHATLSHICVGRWDKNAPISKQEAEALKHQLSEFDGVLMHSEDEIAEQIVPLLVSADLPCVRLYEKRLTPAHSHVVYDYASAIQLAVEHLAKLGYQRIGFIGKDDRHYRNVISKYALFRRFIGECGLELRDEDIWLMEDFNARKTVEQHLSKMTAKAPNLNLPEVFFITTDYFALQAMSGFQAHNIDIPDDLALMSYDDIDQTSLMSPRLTSVHVPRLDMGYQAADMLFNWPMEGNPPDPLVLYADISVHETCPGLNVGQPHQGASTTLT